MGPPTFTSSTFRRFAARLAVQPEERRYAGIATGLLFLIGSVTLAGIALLPEVSGAHRVPMLLLALAGGLVGIVSSTLVDWDRAPVWLHHVLHLVAIASGATIVAWTGGASSPAWVYILFPAFMTAYTYRRPVAIAYLLLCVAVQALPLLYDHEATNQTFIAELLVAAPAYVALGVGLGIAKRWIWSLRSRAMMLAAEQGALRRVATAVVSGEPPELIFEMVAREVAALVTCAAATIMRLQDPETLVVEGAWGRVAAGYLPGNKIAIRPRTDVDEAMQRGSSIRIDELPPSSAIAMLGYKATIVAPVNVGERVWGVLAVAADEPERFTQADEQTLLEFGALLSTAIASIEEHTHLAEQALSDSLTGLANTRAMQERLDAEIARAARHGNQLSIALIDVDHFKDINDNAGHEVGDVMLQRVAAALASFARTEDLVARVGGDEFAWLLPDTSREQALVAVERARSLIAAAPPDPFRITVSVGICDTESAMDPAELIRFADSALYWSKAHGRNQSWIYDSTVADELTSQQRAERLERSQALDGLRALVHALDERDPSTRGHAERVVALVGKLAGAVGWSKPRAAALSEAALLHDVGRITGAKHPTGGISGAEDHLSTEADLRSLRDCALLSAEIVRGVLDDEQVRWIAGQYAWLDDATATSGRGDGGPGHSSIGEESGEESGEIDGSDLITLADAWDRMTALTPGAPEQVIHQSERFVSPRAAARAVEALQSLYSSGQLRHR